MQLPDPCGYRKNYTLIVENEGGELVTQFGPVPYLGSGVVREVIILDLKENQNYSLRVRIETQLQMMTSYKHFFSKLQNSCMNSYYSSM